MLKNLNIILYGKKAILLYLIKKKGVVLPLKLDFYK